VFGRVQMFLGLCAVAFHIVVVSGAGSIHFVNRFQHVLVNFVEIVPIVDGPSEQCASYKRKAEAATASSFFISYFSLLKRPTFPQSYRSR
jgi:hypothetical protein